MKTKAVSLDKLPEPSTIVQTYKDTNGNWFASINSDGWSTCTATFTDEQEAIWEANRVISIRRIEAMTSKGSDPTQVPRRNCLGPQKTMGD